MGKGGPSRHQVPDSVFRVRTGPNEEAETGRKAPDLCVARPAGNQNLLQTVCFQMLAILCRPHGPPWRPQRLLSVRQTRGRGQRRAALS